MTKTGKIKTVPNIFKQRAGNRVSRSISGDLGVFIFLLFMAVLMAAPLYYTVIQSLKPLAELFIWPPRFWVAQPTMNNFKDLFRLMAESWVPFSRYIFNTVFITVVGTFGNVIISSMAAYPLAKYKFPGSAAFFKLVQFSLMFSAVGGGVASYILMAKIGWIDTYYSVIVPGMATSLGLYLMRNFMTNLHVDIFNAAKIDGAGEGTIFWKVVMPNVKAGWLTLMIFAFNSYWSTNNGTYIYSEQFKTMPYGISQITSAGLIRSGASSAASVVMMVVPILIFIINQSNVINTMSSSGIKE